MPNAEAGPLRLYVIEANSHIAPPKRYLSRFGQLLEHAPYCERDLHGPTEPLFTEGTEGTEVEVLVKHRSSRGGSGFVVCNFVPRKVDYHPLSIPVPYYHSNVRTPPTPGPGPAAVAAPPSFPRVGVFARVSRGFCHGESGISAH